MTPLPRNQDIELMLLGGFNASLKGHPIDGISYSKMRALLAYLAVEREQDHRREVLGELLWSGNDPVTARGNLRRTLADLRRVLELPAGKVLFVTSKDTIRLIPNFHVDAVEFLRKTLTGLPDQLAARQVHEEVLTLYRGEFLAGFVLADCPDFEDWLQMQRETMHRRALALLEQLSNDYESSEAYDKALQFALRYVELEPWDEGGHRRIMRLHALGGKESAALAQYAACCAVLKKELGVLPSLDTQQLAERIRHGEFAQRARNNTGVQLHAIAPLPAERRQVTVLYGELSIAAVDDADEAMELLGPPQARCIEIIGRFSGHIVQTHGGGLLAYFGYPHAHEDSARRAVQAALAITREAVQGIEIRVGVHTGLIITDGDASLPDTVGKTSRVAIQLRDCVASGEAAISHATRDLVAGYFDCVDLGMQSLPGAAQPLEVFRVAQETGARTRLDAASQLTPLVGRQTEIAHLMNAWELARQGRSQVVLLQGEPGIGKSRLLHALKQRLTGQPHALRELRCFSEFSQSPFHPLVATLDAAFDFSPGDTAEIKAGKLVHYLENNYPALAQEAIPLLSSLLSLPLARQDQSPGTSSPERQKESTIAILLALEQALAARQPVLLIVEDLHWIDPSTMELLSRLVTQQQSIPLLLVLTARPDFVVPWDKSLTLVLDVAPLATGDMVNLITSIDRSIPAATVQHIVARADGIPLFAEEMTKDAALEHLITIPTTLRDLLAARMDNLGAAKYTAQLAATIGREFDLDLLRKSTFSRRETLMPDLRALQDSGLILQVSKTSWKFKHALIQEAAYQSQVKVERQAAHRRIAQILESDFPAVVASQPEILAQHFSAGGEIRPSIDYWIKAGQRAAQRGANLEAGAHFNSALQFLMTLPQTHERDKTEFAILIDLSPILYATQGYGSEEASRVSARISELRELASDGSKMFLAEWGRLRNITATVGSHGVSQSAKQLLKLAGDEPIRQQAAHQLCAVASFWVGEFESSRAHAEAALALYQPSQHHRMVEWFGENLSISCAGYLSWTLCFLGSPDRAQQRCEQMLSQAYELAHPKTLAMALLLVATLYRWLNMRTKTLSFSAEAIDIARRNDLSHWAMTAEIFHGWAQTVIGDPNGISKIKSSIPCVSTAARSKSALLLSVLTEALIHMKRHEEALGVLAEAQADQTKTGDGHYAAELHRLKGVCLLALSRLNEKEAEACFNQALTVSRQQEAKLLELRAAMSLARLWTQQGKQDESRNLLENVYGRFTEGLDSPDLLEAASLLRALTQATET